MLARSPEARRGRDYAHQSDTTPGAPNWCTDHEEPAAHLFPGVGTLVNVATVLLGAASACSSATASPTRTRDLVTDALGLVTLLIGGLSAWAVTDAAWRRTSATSAPMLIVLASLGDRRDRRRRCCGCEERVEAVGGGCSGGSRGAGSAERHRFIEGFVTSSLVFCTGPLTVLGSLNDGLGNGRRPAATSRPRSTGSPRSRSPPSSAGASPRAR